MTSLTVTNPSTLEPIAELERTDADGVEAMLARAQELYEGGPLPAWQRLEVLRQLGRLMEAEREELAQGIAREGGKPLSDARVEAGRAINGVEAAIAHLYSERGFVTPMGLTERTAGRVAFATREPIGVVLAISAFNHPLNLIIHQVIPAVAVGCPVIVKPASRTPLSCRRVIELLAEAGLPDGWAQFCTCDNELANAMVRDKRVRFLSFIGSAGVGFKLKAELSPGAHCALEHGGVAPVIVHESADVDAMLPKLLKAGYYHAGQVCVSIQRIYVPRDQRDGLAARIAEGAQGLVVGDANEAETDVGPLIATSETERVHSWVREAVDAGAEALCGAEPLGENFYQPTVLVDPPDEVRISTEEVFGPVVCIYGYEEEAEAVRRSNALDVSFQSAVFGRDIDAAMRIAKGFDAAAVMINDHPAFRADWMPFGGYRESGYGMGGIPFSMDDMSRHKLIVIANEAW